DQNPAGFSTMPLDSSGEHTLCDALRAQMAVCAASGSRPALAAVMNTRTVRLAIECGRLTIIAPLFINSISSMRSAVLGEYRRGIRWAREGERAALRLAAPFLSECQSVLGMFVCHEAPAECAREHYQAGLATARASGSFQGTSWALLSELCYLD